MPSLETLKSIIKNSIDQRRKAHQQNSTYQNRTAYIFQDQTERNVNTISSNISEVLGRTKDEGLPGLIGETALTIDDHHEQTTKRKNPFDTAKETVDQYNHLYYKLRASREDIQTYQADLDVALYELANSAQGNPKEAIDLLEKGIHYSAILDARRLSVDSSIWFEAYHTIFSIDDKSNPKMDANQAFTHIIDAYNSKTRVAKHHQHLTSSLYTKHLNQGRLNIGQFLRDLSTYLGDQTISSKGELRTRLEAINFFYDDFNGKAALQGFLKHHHEPEKQQIQGQQERKRYPKQDNNINPEDITKTRPAIDTLPKPHSKPWFWQSAESQKDLEEHKNKRRDKNREIQKKIGEKWGLR